MRKSLALLTLTISYLLVCGFAFDTNETCGKNWVFPLPGGTYADMVCVKDNHSDTVLIGDSRLCFAEAITEDTSVSWIAKGGMGVDWFQYDVIPASKNAFDGKTVVLSLGVNDIGIPHENMNLLLERYKECIDVLKENNPSVTVYVTTIAPLGPMFDGSVQQKNIAYFNMMLRDGFLPVNVIDVDLHLQTYGYDYLQKGDNLHFGKKGCFGTLYCIKEHVEKYREAKK